MDFYLFVLLSARQKKSECVSQKSKTSLNKKHDLSYTSNYKTRSCSACWENMHHFGHHFNLMYYYWSRDMPASSFSSGWNPTSYALSRALLGWVILNAALWLFSVNSVVAWVCSSISYQTSAPCHYLQPLNRVVMTIISSAILHAIYLCFS